MSFIRACIRVSVGLALTQTVLAPSAFAQSPGGSATSTVAAAQPAAGGTPQATERYRDGIVIWETPADARVPFLLKFNINTQIRYLNTQDSEETFTDHLGGAPSRLASRSTMRCTGCSPLTPASNGMDWR